MAYSGIVSLLCSLLVHGHVPATDATATPTINAALSGLIVHSEDQPALSSPAAAAIATTNRVTVLPASNQASVAPAVVDTASNPAIVPFAVSAPGLKYSNIPAELLDSSQPIDRVAAVISSNEGKPTSIDWNDNGKGVSVGIFQANQKVGELPDLLHELVSMPGGQEQVQDAFGVQFTQQVKAQPEAIRQLSFSPRNSLGRGLKTLVQSSIFQKLQVDILRRKVARAAEVAADYGITSTAGVAVCADLTNQWGPGGAHRFLQAADTMRSEGGKVKAIVLEVCKRSKYGNRYQCDLEKIEGNQLSFSEPFYVSNVSAQLSDSKLSSSDN